MKLDWVWRIIFEEGPVSRIGRASAAEMGTASKWWRRVDEISDMVGLEDLMNVIAVKRVNRDGLGRLQLSTDATTWKSVT